LELKINEIRSLHQELALDVIFLGQSTSKELVDYIELCNVIGIVSIIPKNEKHEVAFSHKTYAEYLCAELCVTHLFHLNTVCEETFPEGHLQNVLLCKDHFLIRRFMNFILKNQTETSMDIARIPYVDELLLTLIDEDLFHFYNALRPLPGLIQNLDRNLQLSYHTNQIQYHALKNCSMEFVLQLISDGLEFFKWIKKLEFQKTKTSSGTPGQGVNKKIQAHADALHKHLTTPLRGKLPIHRAARKGNWQLLQLFIANGSDINTRDMENNTPLHYSVQSNDVSFVRKLCSLKGISLEARNNQGRTPLAECVLSRKDRTSVKAVAHELARNGANPDARCLSGNPILELVSKGDFASVEVLLDIGADPNSRLEDFPSFLRWVISLNMPSKVHDLVESTLTDIESVDSRGRTPLHIAAEEEGSGEIIELLIAAGANLHTSNFIGESLLHTAADKNKISLVKQLIENQVDPNLKDNSLKTPLHSAAMKESSAEAVKLLLSYGANPTEVDNFRKTALDYACMKGLAGIVVVFAQHVHSDRKLCQQLLTTALHYATVHENVEIVRILLSYGSNPIAEMQVSQVTPLHYAVLAGNIPLIETLAMHDFTIVNFPDRNQTTALHIAASCNNAEAAQVLVKYGAYPNSKDCRERTPLHFAVNEGNLEVIKILLEHCWTNLSIKDCKSRTALHIAAKSNQVEALRLLLEKGCDTNVLGKSSFTPLHYAAKKGCTDAIQALLSDPSTSVDQPDFGGRTALHIAVNGNKFDAVKSLLANGADPNLRDTFKGKTPLHVAVELGNMESAELLARHNTTNNNIQDSQGRTALHLAVLKDHVDFVCQLLMHDADPNIRDEIFSTPLHYAAQKGRKNILSSFINKFSKYKIKVFDTTRQLPIYNYYISKMVTELLEGGADPNAQDKNGQTPLHYAAASGNSLITTTLAEQQSTDVKLTDASGQSALFKATIRDHVDCVRVLLNNGCLNLELDHALCIPLHYAAIFGSVRSIHALMEVPLKAIDFADGNGKTALHHAVLWDQLETMKILLKMGANPNILDSNRMSPLHYATTGEKSYLFVESLLAHKSTILDLISGGKSTALHFAVQNNCYDTVKLLLTYEADRTLTNSSGKSPVDLARGDAVMQEILSSYKLSLSYLDILVLSRKIAMLWDAESVELLLEKHQIDKCDDWGRTILHYGAMHRHMNQFELVVSHLLKEINSVDFKGKTALHYAVSEHNVRAVGILLQNGADPNIQDQENFQTPLHCAVEAGNSNMAEILVKHPSTNIKLRQKFGLSALHVAVLQAKMDTLEVLLKYFPDINLRDESYQTPLLLAVQMEDLEIIGALLNHTSNEERLSALHYAVQSNSIDSLKLLLAFEAHTNIGDTIIAFNPLHYAVRKNNPLLLELLAKYASKDIDAVDRNGHTALHVAVMNNDGEAAKILLQSGANPDARNKKSRTSPTPLQYAKMIGKTQMVNYLMKYLGKNIQLSDLNAAIEEVQEFNEP
jgi:ankyrin repeat protein